MRSNTNAAAGSDEGAPRRFRAGNGYRKLVNLSCVRKRCRRYRFATALHMASALAMRLCESGRNMECNSLGKFAVELPRRRDLSSSWLLGNTQVHGQIMFKISRPFAGIFLAGLLFTPLLAGAQEAGELTLKQKLDNLLWGLTPFLILIVLFCFFFVRQIKKQGQSPAALQHQAHLNRHEQHMERMEQSMERIAKALEKEKPL